MTRTFSTGIPSNAAIGAHSWWAPCVADHTVALPSRTSATAADGPIDAWSWYGQRYVARTTRDAERRVPSAFPSDAICRSDLAWDLNQSNSCAGSAIAGAAFHR